MVPTFNERENVPRLVDMLRAALPGIDWELIIVDDNLFVQEVHKRFRSASIGGNGASSLEPCRRIRFLNGFSRRLKVRNQSAATSDWRSRIDAAGPAEKQAVICQAVREAVGSVLRSQAGQLA